MKWKGPPICSGSAAPSGVWILFSSGISTGLPAVPSVAAVMAFPYGNGFPAGIVGMIIADAVIVGVRISAVIGSAAGTINGIGMRIAMAGRKSAEGSG